MKEFITATGIGKSIKACKKLDFVRLLNKAKFWINIHIQCKIKCQDVT